MTSDNALLGASALASFAVWELAAAYRAAAPPLHVLRDAPNDIRTRQALLDADVTVGIGAVIAAAAAALVAKSWLIAALVAATFVALAGYHHLILADTT